MERESRDAAMSAVVRGKSLCVAHSDPLPEIRFPSVAPAPMARTA